MKKKILVLGMVSVMLVTMLVGCGASKANYTDDVAAMKSFAEEVESIEDMSDYAKIADKMTMKTDEGKEIKKDLEKLGEYMTELSEIMADLENYDEDAMNELEDKMNELEEKAEKHVEEFGKAAEKSGVSEKDLEDLGLEF